MPNPETTESTTSTESTVKPVESTDPSVLSGLAQEVQEHKSSLEESTKQVAESRERLLKEFNLQQKAFEEAQNSAVISESEAEKQKKLAYEQTEIALEAIRIATELQKNQKPEDQALLEAQCAAYRAFLQQRFNLEEKTDSKYSEQLTNAGLVKQIDALRERNYQEYLYQTTLRVPAEKSKPIKGFFAKALKKLKDLKKIPHTVDNLDNKYTRVVLLPNSVNIDDYVEKKGEKKFIACTMYVYPDQRKTFWFKNNKKETNHLPKSKVFKDFKKNHPEYISGPVVISKDGNVYNSALIEATKPLCKMFPGSNNNLALHKLSTSQESFTWDEKVDGPSNNNVGRVPLEVFVSTPKYPKYQTVFQGQQLIDAHEPTLDFGQHPIVYDRKGVKWAMQAESALIDFLNKKAELFNLSQVRRLLAQLLLFVEGLHKGLAHRDLKPENILIYQLANGEYRLEISDMDDVIAVNEQGKSKKKSLKFQGSPGYIGPEYLGKNRTESGYIKLNFKALDMFACGTILNYFLLKTDWTKNEEARGYLQQLVEGLWVETDPEKISSSKNPANKSGAQNTKISWGESPATRFTVEAVKESKFFGATPEARFAFFESVRKECRYRSRYFDGWYALRQPTSSPEEGGNFYLLPPKIKEVYDQLEKFNNKVNFLTFKDYTKVLPTQDELSVLLIARDNGFSLKKAIVDALGDINLVSYRQDLLNNLQHVEKMLAILNKAVTEKVMRVARLSDEKLKTKILERTPLSKKPVKVAEDKKEKDETKRAVTWTKKHNLALVQSEKNLNKTIISEQIHKILELTPAILLELLQEATEEFIHVNGLDKNKGGKGYAFERGFFIFHGEKGRARVRTLQRDIMALDDKLRKEDLMSEREDEIYNNVQKNVPNPGSDDERRKRRVAAILEKIDHYLNHGFGRMAKHSHKTILLNKLNEYSPLLLMRWRELLAPVQPMLGPRLKGG